MNQQESSSPHRKRRRPNSLEPAVLAVVDDFFSVRGQDDQRLEKVNFLSALEYLWNGCNISPDVYKAPCGGTWSCSSPWSNRHKGVMEQYDQVEEQSHYCESSRRLCMLRVVYELEKLLLHVHRAQRPTGRRETDMAAAERAFSELSGVPIKRVRTLRKRARTYSKIAAQRNGLGILLMLGTQSRDLYAALISSTLRFLADRI